MKRLLVILTGLLSIGVNAQTDKYNASTELRGSGRLVHVVPTVGRFESIETRQFPATITVEVGGTESAVTIDIDDNLRSLLWVEAEDGLLKLAFRDRQDKPFWISKDNVNVKITTPILKRFKHGSNSDVTVNGLRGDSFALINEANGNVTLNGKVNEISIVCSANGMINADKLKAQTASVVTQANATVRINAQQVNEVRQAFAKVINVAEQVPSAATSQVAVARSAQKLVNIRFQNDSPLPRQITLISYTPGEDGNETNGFTLAPYANRQKQYLVGTAVYVATNEQVDLVMRGGRLQSKPFLTVSTDDEGRIIKLVR